MSYIIISRPHLNVRYLHIGKKKIVYMFYCNDASKIVIRMDHPHPKRVHWYLPTYMKQNRTTALARSILHIDLVIEILKYIYVCFA